MGLTYDADIFDGVMLGNLDSVKMYWQDQIDIDFQEIGGYTMLVLAASFGFEEMLQFLLTKNPDQSLQNYAGKTEDI